MCRNLNRKLFEKNLNNNKKDANGYKSLFLLKKSAAAFDSVNNLQRGVFLLFYSLMKVTTHSLL
jgi:hypothetical protein